MSTYIGFRIAYADTRIRQILKPLEMELMTSFLAVNNEIIQKFSAAVKIENKYSSGTLNNKIIQSNMSLVQTILYNF